MLDHSIPFSPTADEDQFTRQIRALELRLIARNPSQYPPELVSQILLSAADLIERREV